MFTKTIVNALHQACPRTYYSCSPKRPKFWSKEVNEACKQARKSWCSYYRSQAKEDWQEYVAARRLLQKEIRNAKKMTGSAMCRTRMIATRQLAYALK